MKLTTEQESLLDSIYELLLESKGLNVPFPQERSQSMIEEQGLLSDDNMKEQFTNASIAFGLCPKEKRNSLLMALVYTFLRPSDIHNLTRSLQRLSQKLIEEYKTILDNES